MRRLASLAARPAREFPPADVPSVFRRCAVLHLVWSDAGGDLSIALTQRAARLRSHSGEVSLPGGRLDDGEDHYQAAVRETHEELGVEPSAVRVLGRLDDAWSGAGNHLVPVVGWHEGRPRFRPNHSEVAAVHEVPLAQLRAPGALTHEAVQAKGQVFVREILTTPHVRFYGLTADLVLELIEFLDGVDTERHLRRLEELRAVWGAAS